MKGSSCLRNSSILVLSEGLRKNNLEEMGEKNVKNEGLMSQEEKVVDIAMRGSTGDRKSIGIENDVTSLPAEKRRLHGNAYF